MKLNEIFEVMIEKDISDIFLRVDCNLRGRIYSQVKVINPNTFSVEDIDKIIKSITGEAQGRKLQEDRACEFTYWYKEYWRFRLSIFYQRNTPSIVIRKIDLRVPPLGKLNLPSKILKKLASEKRGIVLLTGVTGSGKSTTIASMMDYVNENLNRHILTIEEPIEFTFKDNKSIINQREIGSDVKSYKDALKQFALHSPDVIYIGNIRDFETCHAALTAAETGVLVFSTLHTINAVSTIERIVNFYPPHQQAFVINQLSTLLKGVFSQRLIPRGDKPGLIPAYESMILSPSVARLIRENKFWEISKYISSGDVYGMKSFHQCLLELVEKKKVSPRTALDYADKREELEMDMRNKGLM